MTGALAMKLRLELAQLAQRHRVVPAISCALPLAPQSSRPVLISGVAAARTTNQERMRFAPWSLMFLPWKPPPLLFRHREPAGEILKLEHDGRGRLLIDARVGGLSVSTIQKYEIRNQDDPAKFHALITRADVDEISLTPTPCNPDYVITMLVPVSCAHETFDLAERGSTRCARSSISLAGGRFLPWSRLSGYRDRAVEIDRHHAAAAAGARASATGHTVAAAI